MLIEKSILLKNLELLQSLTGKDEESKVIITKDGLIGSFQQGAFVTFIGQKFDFSGVFDLPTFLSIVKSINSDELEIEPYADKPGLKLSALRTSIVLKEEDVPNKETIISSIKIGKEEVKDLPEKFITALTLCSMCASTKESILSNISIGKNTMGSDESKLGIYKLGFDQNWLLEKDFADKIIKLNPVSYIQDGLKVTFFRSTDTYSICNLSSGDYPDMKMILDKTKKVDAEIKIPSELKEAIDVSIGLFASIREQESLMLVGLLKNRITIKTESERGWMEKTIRAKYSGKEFSFIIDANILRSVSGKSETIYISDKIARIPMEDFTLIFPIELRS